MYSIELLVWCSLLLQAGKHALLHSLLRQHDLNSAQSDGYYWQYSARRVAGPQESDLCCIAMALDAEQRRPGSGSKHCWGT